METDKRMDVATAHCLFQLRASGCRARCRRQSHSPRIRSPQRRAHGRGPRAALAPVTLTAEADATALVRLRRHLREDGVEVSYNDLLLCVLGRALREHPC